MALNEQIASEMKAALLGGDRFVGETLRNLKAAILNEEVALKKRDTGLDDTEIEKIVAREVKKRAESAKLYHENSREDLAENEEKEMAILQKYLPEQISEAELTDLVTAKISETGASGPQDMGRVIGAVKQAAGNTADGALTAQIVKKLLQPKQ